LQRNELYEQFPLYAYETSRLRREKNCLENIRLFSSRTEPIYTRQDNHNEDRFCQCQDPKCSFTLDQRTLHELDSPLWNPDRVFDLQAHQNRVIIKFNYFIFLQKSFKKC